MRRAMTLAARVAKKAAAGARDERGVTAVEFSIVAVPFVGLLLLVFQVALYFFSLQSLDFATRLAGRAIMTGQAPINVSAATFTQQVICPNVFWSISCSDLVVNAYVVAKASSATTGTGVYSFIDTTSKALKNAETDPTKQRFCLGGPGDYVYLDVAYKYPNYVARLLSSVAGTTMSMRSGSMVYNEPISGTRSC